MARRWIPVPTALVAMMFLSGCLVDEGGPTGGDEPEVPESVVATFRLEGETFKVWVTGAGSISDLYSLWNGNTTKSIPVGPLLAGSGESDHNLPWSWHLHPLQTVLVSTPPAGCSASPSVVEANLEAWLVIGQYCPVGAELIGLVAGSPS